MDIKEKIEFIEEYKNAKNAATGSKYDPNANVSEKNIMTLAGELPKKDNIDLQRAVMKNYLTKLYGEETAKQYEKDLNHHIIYRHDESSGSGGFPYCASISLYPFLLNGLKKVGGTSCPPQHTDSYIGGLINLIFLVSSQFVGAVAAPETLTYMDHFLRKDYGNDYINILDNVVEFRKSKQRKLRERIEDWFAQFVYSINQPCAARNYQSVFFNIAYFDESYFKNIFKDFVFPDGDEPCWETTKVLQKMFMKWFNNERLKEVITFPVETMNLLVDKTTGEYVDKDMADFASEMWAEGASFFCYQSDSVDSLSSCCFDGDEKILVNDSNHGPRYMTFRELSCEKYKERRNFSIFHNGSWVKGNLITAKSDKLIRIETSNNKVFLVTPDHINPTLSGEKPASELTVNDYLLFNTNALDSYPEKDEKFTYEEGYLLGLYAGDGSSYLAHKDGHNFNFAQVAFHLNKEKNAKSIPILEKALKDLDIDCNLREYIQKNNNYCIQFNSRSGYDFIKRFIFGKYAYDKNLSSEILSQSKDFRKGILDGLYDSDGGNTNRIYSCSKNLIDSIEFLMTSLGLTSKIEAQDRRNEPILIRGKKYKRNYILYSIRWYDPKNKRSMKNIYTLKNNSLYFKIKSVTTIDNKDPGKNVYCFKIKNTNEPYFTLPSGLITHNCRLRNGIEENVFSYTLGAGGIETGSKAVITMNLNRIVQDWFNNEKHNGIKLSEYIEKVTINIHKYLSAFNQKLWDDFNSNLLPVFKAGFIDLDKQYLTVGINGFVEAAEFLNIKISPDCQEYKQFAKDILKTIEDTNKRDRTVHCRYNLEFVPAENLGVKNYNWDKKDGYMVPSCRNLYNSYFYPVEANIDPVKKFYYQGAGFVDQCSGGSALHNNLEEHLSKKQYRMLMDVAVKAGCPYFTYNIRNTVCNDCGFISKSTLHKCPKCGSTNLDYLTRVIGYLKRVSNFSEARQEEAAVRYYGDVENKK